MSPLPHRPRHRATSASRAMGALFAVGSVCFAVASMPWFFDSASTGVVAWTFFVGSIFFTSAAALQFQQSEHEPGGDGARGVRAALRSTSRIDDRWASAVQLIGTLCFNVSTFAATRAAASVQQQRRLIWAPDVLGSVCFLAASIAAWVVTARAIRGADGRLPRVISGLNLAGSAAFGAAAIAARYLRPSGEVANIELVNAGTFVGAVCFFLGAVLLPVDSARAAPPPGGPSDRGAPGTGAPAPRTT